jgi:hypothetical protein
VPRLRRYHQGDHQAALLTDDEKVMACTLAKAAGADYVKPSTGFGPGGATPADVALIGGSSAPTWCQSRRHRDLRRAGDDRGRRDAR